MLNIKRKHIALIFLLLAINTSTPVYARYYNNSHKSYKTSYKPVKKANKTISIDKHIQVLTAESPEPSPTPDFGKDIANINKNNVSIKQDVVLLREMVNNLSKDLSEQKSRNSESLNKQKDLENKAQLLTLILFVTIFFLLIAIYMIYLKIKENSKKDIKDNIDSFMKNTKIEILKDFKINETDFYAYTQNITTKKMDEFENSLDTRFGDYNRKITTNTEKETNDFKSNLENDVKAQLDNFSSTIQNKFNENKEAFINQIQDKFPGTDINSMIVNLAKEQGFLQSINTQLENNVKEVVNKEFEKIERHLNNKEKTIVADIQKVHLANNHFNIGNIFMKSKNYPQAINEFLEAIRTDNNFYGAYLNLGKAYENNEQSKEAIESYN
ncbi:MAG: tetratricopeptide repeat protein, partial [Candidatus Sericytochromatia bacterium]|nr:tetratricopeptide repeat protein [Candidatus Sericytochromatia bacterium]